MELTREAQVTEPLRASWYQWLAGYLSGLDRLDEAERAVRRALELQPGSGAFHEQLGVIEIQRGNAQAAPAAAQQEIPGVWQYVAMALARQVGSDRSAADAALKALIDLDAEGAPYQIAEVYALHNDPDETFAWLDRACSRAAGMGYRLYDPFILRCKDDPRLPPRFAKRCVCQRRLKLASEPEFLRLLPTLR